MCCDNCIIQKRENFEVGGDDKMEIIAYGMRFQKDIIEQSNISCVPFEEKYFSTYMHIYNECFYEMRKTLNIEPYNFLNDYEQIKEKSKAYYYFYCFIYLHTPKFMPKPDSARRDDSVRAKIVG